jgi:hypothetical protein
MTILETAGHVSVPIPLVKDCESRIGVFLNTTIRLPPEFRGEFSELCATMELRFLASPQRGGLGVLAQCGEMKRTAAPDSNS